jgi:hypothetical protein
VEEVQRSIGYYKSINPGTRISGILALGGSFKLPGLAKYVSENLQHMPVRNLTDPQNFDMSVARNPRVFEESALSFGVALGLLVQGCGLAGMGISLLPQELLQRKIIARKKPWAAAVAACALVMFGTAYYSTWRKGKELSEANSDSARKFVKNAQDLQDRYTELTNVTVTKGKLDQIEKLWTGRDFWMYALRKVFAPVPPEPDNEKGVWYRRVVSETVDFETVAEAITQGVTNDLAGLGFKTKGMELESGWLEKLKSRIRRSDTQPIEFNAAVGQVARRPAAVQKVQRPDVVYMVIQGETTDPGAGVYVTNTLIRNLTNEWQCMKCKVVLRGMEPPEKCQTPDCGGTRADFRLEEHSRPLIQDVRFVASQQEERFVDHMDRLVGIETLGEDVRKTWENILRREEDIKAGRLATWTAGEKPGEEPLPRRDKFLAKLEQVNGVRVELFTDFEIAFFLDPSGDLMDEVAKRRQAAAEARAAAAKAAAGLHPGEKP